MNVRRLSSSLQNWATGCRAIAGALLFVFVPCALDHRGAFAWADDEEVGAPARPVVVLLGFPAGDPLFDKLRLELLAMQFTVVLDDGAGADSTSLEQMEARGAALAVTHLPSGDIEVLLGPRRRLLLAPPSDTSPGIVAKQVAEQIRASFVLGEEEAVPSPPPREPSPPVPSPSEEGEEASPSLWSFSASLGVGYEAGAGGLDGSARGAILGEVERALSPRHSFGWGFRVEAPFMPLEYESELGQAEVSVWDFMSGPAYFFRPHARLALVSSLSAGVATIHTRADAAPPHRASDDRRALARIRVALGLRYSLSERFFLGGEAAGQVLLPELRVHFLDDVAARRAGTMGAFGVTGVKF